jgi:hypothetical protein
MTQAIAPDIHADILVDNYSSLIRNVMRVDLLGSAYGLGI